MPNPEPMPAPRPPAQFVREVEPQPKKGPTPQFAGDQLCSFCKRRDGTHSKGCRRKGGTRRAAPAAAPTGSGGETRRGPVPRFLSADPLVNTARDLVRQRLDEEIASADAYLTELRRVRAEV